MMLVQWTLARLAWLASNVGFTAVHSEVLSDVGLDQNEETFILVEEEEGKNKTEKGLPNCPINKTRPESCDHQMNRYILQYKNIDDVTKLYTGDCSERETTNNFVIRHIENTNLILVVVNTLCGPSYPFEPSDAKEIMYPDAKDFGYICHRYTSNNLPRRRPKDCITYHDKEKEMKDSCGRGSTKSLTTSLLALLTLVSLWCHSS